MLRNALAALAALFIIASASAQTQPAQDFRFSATSGNIPGVSDSRPLNNNTLGINRADGKLFFRRPDGTLGTSRLFSNAATSIATTGGTVTLTVPQLATNVIKLTGTLASAVTLVFPANEAGQWSVINATSGAYTVTGQVAGQSSGAIGLPAGQPRTVSSDGTALTSPVSQATGLTTPQTTITNNLACWGGTTGQSLIDCGWAIGTGGTSVPLLSGTNSWSGAQTFAAASVLAASNPSLTIGLPSGQQYLFSYNTGAAGFGVYDPIGGLFRMFFQNTTARTGINTITPGATFDVAGTLRGQIEAWAGATPTTTELPASKWTVGKGGGLLKLCANDGGTVKCVTLN